MRSAGGQAGGATGWRPPEGWHRAHAGRWHGRPTPGARKREGDWEFGVPGIFDNARDGLLLVRYPEARVVLANRSARDLLRLPSATEVGFPLARVFPDPDIQSRAAASALEAVGEWPGHGQAPLRTRWTGKGRADDDGLDELEVSFCRVDDVGRGGPLVLLVVRRGAIAELADLARRGAKAQRRVDELERKAKDLALFFGEAAHEFNTPLTVVLLQSKLLQNALGPLAPGQQKALARIDTNVHRLMLLSQDLMDLARADAGKLLLHLETVDLAEAVAREVRNLQDLADERGISLRLQDAGRPLPVHGEAARLRQVAANFLGNALKFTHPGGHVEVRLGTEGGDAWVAVRDDGPGMAAADVARLFQPFVRIPCPGLPAKPGTGLGLYLSKRIVEAHGGHASASSPGLGQGMEFRLTIPLLGAKAKPASARPAAPRRPAPQRRPAPRRRQPRQRSQDRQRGQPRKRPVGKSARDAPRPTARRRRTQGVQT